MKIPKYWAKETQSVTSPDGRAFALACWQWSNESQLEAAQRAQARIRTVAAKVQRNETLQRYIYGEQPIREEIIQAIRNRKGNEIGIVTRNGYGALVVNAVNAMFIDIDFEQERAPGMLAWLVQSIFGKTPISQEERLIAHIETWAQTRPELGIRIYRTFAGLRCLVTSEVFSPTDASTQAILRELNSDPLYMTLCKRQECFRARLTPKPWRCGIPNPPSRYPWENQHVMAQYRQWEQTYTATAARFTTCRFIKHVGRSQVHPDVQTVLDLHDQQACGNPQLELA
ncbi:MAG: hypothetical protein JXA33_00230 [Anaerolineae bacterium]|nr:hypothetical protein [Anaerolineae bacterium]